MKIALLGKGKTGSKILEIAGSDLFIEVFDRTHRPSVEKLAPFDVIVSFLPGEAFLEMIPMLIETKKPVVTGSTGFAWPEGMDASLKSMNTSWIFATNFSLGVVAVKQLVEKLHKLTHLFSEKSFSIHEVHHTKKVDAPSGTALSMKEWLNEDCVVTSERTGDVVGLHTLKLETPSEIIRIEHEAKNRTLFAEGALWSARIINQIEPGLHPFQKVVERQLSL